MTKTGEMKGAWQLFSREKEGYIEYYVNLRKS
jgi:hypothetical protein